MSDWKSIDDLPPIGSKFVVLYNDGSGSKMFWRHDYGYIDCEGGEYEELSAESYSLWTELPDGLEFWCEVRSEDPMRLVLPPAKCPVCDGVGIIYDCEKGCDECRRPCYECQPAQSPAHQASPDQTKPGQ